MKLMKHLSSILICSMCLALFGCNQSLQSSSNDTQSSDSQSNAFQPSNNQRNSDKPNIIVIYTDDMNFEDAAVFGGNVLTPTIDKLANEGARFDRYYAASPVCSPSRYNVLTGRYASHSSNLKKQYPANEPAFIRWNTHIEEQDTTVAKYLKESGYVTGMVGKYHNIDNEPTQLKNPIDADPNDPKVKDRITQNYQNLRSEIQDITGFDYVENIYANNLHALELPKVLQQHNQEWITEAALDFIDNNADKPFYLYLATTTPHVPSPVESMKSDPRITPSGFLDKAPQVQASRDSVFERIKQAGLPESAAVMLWIDDAIKAVLDKLAAQGVLDNTIIIFASDHSGAHGGRGKMTNYEGGVNTPAFVWWKDKITSGQVIDSLASSVDIVPTILDAAGVNRDDKLLDGESWLPMLAGETKAIRDEAYLEITYTRGVVTDEWKYIAVRFPSELQSKVASDPSAVNQEGLTMTHDALSGAMRSRYNAHELHPGYFDQDQLYNLKNDPNERVNLANDKQYADVLAMMQEKLKKYTQQMPHDFGEFK